MNNISFIGMAGCGKSTLGGVLSSQLGISFVDTDLLIEEKFKLSLEQLKKEKGYEFVRQAEEKEILGLNENIKVISTGGSAVYSEKSMLYLSSFSKIIYINTPLDEIKKRIGDGQERGLAAPEGISIEDIYKERVPLYDKWADITLNGDRSIEDLISKIIGLI
jgi:shikimate kinase